MCLFFYITTTTTSNLSGIGLNSLLVQKNITIYIKMDLIISIFQPLLLSLILTDCF